MDRNDQEFIVEKIRTQYIDKEDRDINQLKAMDAKVKRPANLLAYTLGTLGAIIMGSGMSLVMTDISEKLGISNPMVSGIVIGVIGLAVVTVNYPLYKRILSKRRKKYAQAIIAVSNSIIKKG